MTDRTVAVWLTEHDDDEAVGYRYEARADPQPEFRFINANIAGYSDTSENDALDQLARALGALGIDAELETITN